VVSIGRVPSVCCNHYYYQSCGVGGLVLVVGVYVHSTTAAAVARWCALVRKDIGGRHYCRGNPCGQCHSVVRVSKTLKILNPRNWA